MKSQVDISVLNQYETALQLMNAEIQKLLMRNDQLQKENQMLKQQNEQFQIKSQMNQVLINFNNGDAAAVGINPNDLNGNPMLWLNSQLKDAKSQLQDMRHQNQNFMIELRALNDKRDMERKDLVLAQEKLAEQIGQNRSLYQNQEQLKIELTNQVNTRQGLEKICEQSESQKKIMAQELDLAEQQKLT